MPRVFWSSLSKPTYIDTRWGLYEPAFWEGRRCIARQTKAKLELDPVYKEEQRVREAEGEALVQRRRDEEAAEAQRRQAELQARRDQMDMWYEGRKIAESWQRKLMSDAVEALQRLMKNERCSEASCKAYVKQLAAAQAGTLNKQKAESIGFLAGSL